VPRENEMAVGCKKSPNVCSKVDKNSTVSSRYCCTGTASAALHRSPNSLSIRSCWPNCSIKSQSNVCGYNRSISMILVHNSTRSSIGVGGYVISGSTTSAEYRITHVGRGGRSRISIGIGSAWSPLGLGAGPRRCVAAPWEPSPRMAIYTWLATKNMARNHKLFLVFFNFFCNFNFFYKIKNKPENPTLKLK
jgi:hypothetical protein